MSRRGPTRAAPIPPGSVPTRAAPSIPGGGGGPRTAPPPSGLSALPSSSKGVSNDIENSALPSSSSVRPKAEVPASLLASAPLVRPVKIDLPPPIPTNPPSGVRKIESSSSFSIPAVPSRAALSPGFTGSVLPANVLPQAPIRPKSMGARSQAVQQKAIPPSVEPETNKELRALIEVIAANCWNNRPWVRANVRLKQVSPAPAVPVGAERVDLKGFFKTLAGSLPNHKILQQLYLHSCTLSDNPQDWVLTTFARLHHLLHIFFLMSPPKTRRSIDLRASSGGDMSGKGGKEDASDMTTQTNEIQIGCTCSFKTEIVQTPVQPKWEGIFPTHEIALANRDCSLLFLNAFLAREGQTLLLWLIAELLDTQVLLLNEPHHTPDDRRLIQHRIGKSLECILKIFWYIQSGSSVAGVKLKMDKIIVGECDAMKFGGVKVRISATTWIEKEKPLWWAEAAIDEAIRIMTPWGIPGQVTAALMEILIDSITIPPVIDDFSPPAYHIKLFKKFSILPLITSAFLASTFTGLESCLRYFTFLVIQKVDNARSLLEECKHIAFVMPTVLTAGTTTRSAQALKELDPVVAEEKATGIVRLSITFLVAVFQLYFQNVDTRESEAGTTMPPTFSAVLFAAFDALEDTAHTWNKDTCLRVGTILQSLLVRIGKNAKTVKQDICSFIWESVFQLSFVLEDFIFYSGYSELPRLSPRHFKTFEMRPDMINTVEIVLVTQFHDFLAQLEIALQDDEVQRTPVQKKRFDLLRARVLEERSLWSKTIELLEKAKLMDFSTLTRDKQYKTIEALSRQRRSHFGDPTLNAKISSALVQVKISRSPPESAKRSITSAPTSAPPSVPSPKSGGHRRDGSGLTTRNRTSLSDQLSRVHMDGKEEFFAELAAPQHSVVVDGIDPEHDPACWKAYADPYGLPLYFNVVTKSLCEDQPSCMQLDPLIDPLCWEEFKDPSGEVFYFNNKKSVISYDAPPLPEKLEPLPLELKRQYFNSSRSSSLNELKTSLSGTRPHSMPSPAFTSAPVPPSTPAPPPLILRPAAPPLPQLRPRDYHLQQQQQLQQQQLQQQRSQPSHINAAVDRSEDDANPRTPPPEVLAWREAFDAINGPYFYNKLTKETTYNRPACLVPYDIPQMWEETYDPQSKRNYYYNKATKISTYVQPSCLRNAVVTEVISELSPEPSKSLVYEDGSLEGWREGTDQATGELYWYNKITRESTFDRPRFMTMVDSAWAEATDSASGKVYWFNKLTMQSTWIQPAGFLRARST